jgi:hypothetical protein
MRNKAADSRDCTSDVDGPFELGDLVDAQNGHRGGKARMPQRQVEFWPCSTAFVHPSRARPVGVALGLRLHLVDPVRQRVIEGVSF